MQWRIGLLGWGLVLALVVGVIADQPTAFPPAEDSYPGASEAGSSPDQVGWAAKLPPKPLGAAEITPQVGAAGELIGFNGFDGSGSQTITLVHTRKMQIAVYHIDRSGQIRLVSSRPIDADFSVSLNVTKPLPGEIRLLGGQVK